MTRQQMLNMLTNYQEKAKEFAIFPKGVGISYCTLGLIDELGELSEQLFMFMPTEQESLARHRESTLLEFGDVLWYIVVLASELKIELIDLSSVDNSLISWRLHLYEMNSMFKDCAALAGIVKKSLRGDGLLKKDKATLLLSTILTKLIKTLVVWSATTKSAELLSEVCSMNIKKLTSRAERNVIKGEGDYR